MERVRALLLELPTLLRDILERAIHDDGECELVEEEDLVGTRGERSPDVVVLGLRTHADTTLVPALLSRWPRAQVITVMQEGDAAVIHELRARQRVLGETSASEIVGVLRDAVQRSRSEQRYGEDVDAGSR